MRKTIEVECCICCKKVERYSSEVKRSIKLGRKFYCSLNCSGKGNNGHLEVYRTAYDISKHCNNLLDEFSPFRYHLNNIRNHSKGKKEVSITLEDLKEQWDKQKGVCPYTGWELINPKSMSSIPKKTPNRASVDRIDSSKGYIKGNIQFVSLIAQFAKCDWTETELKLMGESIILKF